MGPAEIALQGLFFLIRSTTMNLMLEVPQIFAKELTHPRTDADEIYMAYFVTLAKKGDVANEALIKKFHTRRISTVRRGVNKGTVWKPELLEAVIDTADAEAMFVNIGFYEYDSGDIYEKLKEATDVIVPDSFDWSVITIPEDMKDWMGWIRIAWKLSSSVYSYLRQDDLLGSTSIAMPSLTESAAATWSGLRELKFKNYGGDYRVNLNITVL